MLVLQHQYNRSDDQAEYLVQDRLSFQRFSDKVWNEVVPDREKTKLAILWNPLWDDWKGNTL